MCETLVRLADEYECQYRTSVKSAPKTNGRRTNMPGIADKRANRALIRLATSQARVYAGELRARVEALIAERHVNEGASSRDVERVVNSNSMLAMPGLTHDERARILLGTLPGASLVVSITDRSLCPSLIALVPHRTSLLPLRSRRGPDGSARAFARRVVTVLVAACGLPRGACPPSRTADRLSDEGAEA